MCFVLHVVASAHANVSHTTGCGSTRLRSSCTQPRSVAPEPTSSHSSSIAAPLHESLAVGCRVQLSPHFASCSDAEKGPLKPGDIGTVVARCDDSKPFKVEFSAKTWWYERSALSVASSDSSSSPPVASGSQPAR